MNEERTSTGITTWYPESLNINDPDADSDGDGVSNNQDHFPRDSREWLDLDFDGIGNNLDEDDDGDGVPDSEDIFPENPFEQSDSDEDGIGDFVDPDPENPNIKAFTTQEALAQITDDALLTCLTKATEGLLFADELTNVRCDYEDGEVNTCLLYTSPSPRDGLLSRMPSSA